MQPQGSAPFDADYFDALIAQINGINLCADLQALVTEVFASIQAEKNALEAQLAALLPVLALLDLPTDLGSVITWIGNLANHLIGPIIIPYTTYATELAELLTKITALATAIENAAARIESCSITVPTLT